MFLCLVDSIYLNTAIVGHLYAGGRQIAYCYGLQHHENAQK